MLQEVKQRLELQSFDFQIRLSVLEEFYSWQSSLSCSISVILFIVIYCLTWACRYRLERYFFGCWKLLDCAGSGHTVIVNYFVRLSLFFKFLFIYLFNIFIGIIALQWCVSFCFITKWISYTYTYIPIYLPSCVSLPPTLPIPPL